jgi:hypothetical protein
MDVLNKDRDIPFDFVRELLLPICEAIRLPLKCYQSRFFSSKADTHDKLTEFIAVLTSRTIAA